MERFPIGRSAGKLMVVMGDFNAKGGEWDKEAEPIREEMVMRVAREEGLAVLNENGRKTWRRGIRSAVLDLT